ncbi:MAG: hypothetical protein M3Y41_21120 [Pseudomonadota bacterium]|nr:hypothetical protein [Pseudomonadota bacterium]
MVNEAFAGAMDAWLGGGADEAAGRGPTPRLTLLPAPRPNLLRLVCHPNGTRRTVVNWAEVTRDFLLRVAGEIRATHADPGRRPPLEEVMTYSGVKSMLRGNGGGPSVLLPVVLRRPDGTTQRLISTIATLGTAQDLTLRELRIETYHLA